MKKYFKVFYIMLFFTSLLFAEQKKDVNLTKSSCTIAVAAVEETANSQISEIAGKAPYYLIFDEKGILLQSIKNPAQNSRRNSSSLVVDFLVQKSCKTVIAGKFGTKMQKQLKANNIQFYEHEGIAKEVLQSFTKK
jgi:predicted Fe-Mo cluster-binding NifX family protein